MTILELIEEIRRNRDIDYHSHTHLDQIENEFENIKDLLKNTREVLLYGRSEAIKKDILEQIDSYLKD